MEYRDTFRGWFFKVYEGKKEVEFPDVSMLYSYVIDEYEQYCKEKGIEPHYN